MEYVITCDEESFILSVPFALSRGTLRAILRDTIRSRIPDAVVLPEEDARRVEIVGRGALRIAYASVEAKNGDETKFVAVLHAVVSV